MGINTDLNIEPYFDDYDQTKQYNKILFKPSVAVQARELTQLQTILQNQVERFGQNVYKEGTIISGINITKQSNLEYIKVNDQAGFNDPTVYNPTEEVKYFMIGETSGLRAEIETSLQGFQTRDPDLKTFYINYLDSNGAIKRFQSGENIRIVNSVTNATEITVNAASVLNHAGGSYAVSVSEGIIFQKGHFIFVENQIVVVSKYSTIPGDVAVGFKVQENIVSAIEDPSLYDNALGSTNFTAPGADRLQLKPILTVLDPSSNDAEEESKDFFALIRFERGQAVSIRDVTQFNSITTEMARRTFDESGNYVVDGLQLGLFQEQISGNTYTYATVSPGKAYVQGYEINNIANIYLEVEPSTDISERNNQSIGIEYGGYFEFPYGIDQGSDVFLLNDFDISGQTRAEVYDNSEPGILIGSCSVRNIEPGTLISGTSTYTNGKLYVYAIKKNAGFENTPIGKIKDTPVIGNIKGLNRAAPIFDIGVDNGIEISDTSMVVRKKLVVDPASDVVTISPAAGETTLSSNIIGITSANEIQPAQSVQLNPTTGDISITFAQGAAVARLFYTTTKSNATSDSLEQVTVFIKSSYTGGLLATGLPNVVDILSVEKVPSSGSRVDVTSKFTLVNNQKDGYYDYSYLKLRTGESISDPTSATYVIKAVALRRSSVGTENSFLSVNSYINVDEKYIKSYTSASGQVYNLKSSLDFRSYVRPKILYALSEGQQAQVISQSSIETSILIAPSVTPGNISVFTSDISYYLSRIDNVVVNGNGEFQIAKGSASSNPMSFENGQSLTIGKVYVPGNSLSISGQNPLRVESKSVKNYTMKEIGDLDKNIKRLTDVVSLSLLETETKDIFIPDGSGNNRFKNGIVVDSFKDISVADITNPESKFSLDTGYKVITPQVSQFNVDLKLNVRPNSVVSSTNYTSYPDITTISEIGESVIINQKYATNYRNAVSNKYYYKGSARCHPQFDSGYDEVQNPDANISIDLATPLQDLVNNIQQFIPLTSVSSVNTSNQTRTALAGGGTRITTVNTTTSLRRELESSVSTNTQVVGNFLTDFRFRPFVRARNVRILVNGLRPNTRHYIYFDETPVSQFTAPGTCLDPSKQDERQVFAIGRVNEPLISDGAGSLSAVLRIPASTFYVGENDVVIADVDQYDSIESAASSRSRFTYRAYSFSSQKSRITTSTRTPDFSVSQTVSTNRTSSSRDVFPPPPPRQEPERDRSCFVAGTIVTMADGSKKQIEDVTIGEKLVGQDGSINTVLEYDHPMLGGRDLYGINNLGPFMTPEHPVYTKDGWKAPRMKDTMIAYPHLESIMVGDLKVGDKILKDDGSWFLIESLQVYENEPEQQVYNFILNGNNTYFADGLLAHNRDPLSQTFFVKQEHADSGDAIYVDNIDLYFKSKSSTQGVTVQLREVKNGYPTDVILSFGSAHLMPNDVNVSDDGSVATNVRFPNPVKLNTEKEYCFVILPDGYNPDYTVFTSKVGGIDLASDVAVVQDWGEGVLFTSTNDKAWKSYQDEDVKFSIRRLIFSDSNAVINLEPNDPEFFRISGNSGTYGNDEEVFVLKNTQQAISFVAKGLTTGYITLTSVNNTSTESQISNALGFNSGNAIRLTRPDGQSMINKIVSISTPPENITATNVTYEINFEKPYMLNNTGNNTTTATLIVSGKVSFYNGRTNDRLYLSASTALQNAYFSVGDIVYGQSSGAYARIDNISNELISYFQPFVYAEEPVGTSVSLQVVNEGLLDVNVAKDDNSYMTGVSRRIASKSNVVLGNISQDAFSINVTMGNNGVETITPYVDDDLSSMQVYQYAITSNETDTSTYVTKEITLQEDMAADGLKVLIAAYKPVGTMIDVHAKFRWSVNTEEESDWIQLDNESLNTYSNVSNVRDYRDLSYSLDEDDVDVVEFTSFRVKVVMRHATRQELFANNLPVNYRSFNFNINAAQTVLIGTDDAGNALRYTPNNVEVYVNNSETPLSASQFEGVDGLQITLVNALEVGDTVRIDALPDVNLFPHLYDFRAIAVS